MGWTKEQSDAINYREGNLLVSAAAGSGKTAVLIERIVKRVTDPKNPVDVDSILVVTFTKAAAEELKARLGKAFEKEIELNPGNAHLIKQLTLIDNAKISTIDKFCTYILRNYYNTIDFDPAFRIADEGEVNLIMTDVMETLIEKNLKAGSEKFLDFVEAYAPGKSIQKISDLVFGLFRFSQSNPWPGLWLKKCKDFYRAETNDEYMELPVVKSTYKYVKRCMNECAFECETMLRLCNEPSGPESYIPAITADLEHFRAAADAESFESLKRCMDFSFDKLARAVKVSEELKLTVQNLRKEVKSRKEKLYEKFMQDTDRQFQKFKETAPFAEVLIDLTTEFCEEYRLAKQKKGIADFSDVEHYALDILIDIHEDKISYTNVADELASEFNEIYIDEYQDSNTVQEYILNAVSRERFGYPNIFMVGDIKQSIYKFRMARPELFMEKYDAYSSGKGPYRKIELHKNFRSRPNVLDSINDIFFTAMKKEVGGVEYTKDVMLNPGGDFPQYNDDATEILLADETEFSGEDIKNTEICAYMAAERISRLKSDNPSIKYRDIVILLRSDKVAGPVYASVLTACKIPCVYASSTGYFSSYEVRTIMDLLRIIDNPRQEIPLAGVMRSFFCYFSAEELALIKGPKRRTELYDCVVQYSRQSNTLGHKCRQFLETLNLYREISGRDTIEELLVEIIYNTGYYDYIGSMSGGTVAKSNLDMLIVKAREYRNTSYSGLFNFLRYMEKLQKYDIDYGEAGIVSEEEDVVRIMSIHKSKGLEFPVVIIGDMAKRYNLRDISEPVIYDGDAGIGMDRVDLTLRAKEVIPYKTMVAHKILSDSIGEELRILYVAMTRAVDKLIMIGVTRKDSSLKKWNSVLETGEMNTSYLLENPRYIDVVMPGVMKPVKQGRFAIRWYDRDTVLMMATKPIADKIYDINGRIEELQKGTVDEKEFQRIKSKLEYKYPYSDVFSLKSKYSVSELKHKAMEESEYLEARIVSPDKEKPVPEFMKHEKQVLGTFVGNAYHKAFELFDYDTEETFDGINTMMDGWVIKEVFPKEYRDIVNPQKLLNFLNTEIGADMKNAAKQGMLFRERPFVMEVSGNEISSEYPENEKVLIQGIIDAFYFKDDKIYVVDYKTDNVPDGSKGEKILLERYRRQLMLYCEALSRITGKEIGGCFIYSVKNDKDIRII